MGRDIAKYVLECVRVSQLDEATPDSNTLRGLLRLRDEFSYDLESDFLARNIEITMHHTYHLFPVKYILGYKKSGIDTRHLE
jgi:hypothetical protein